VFYEVAVRHAVQKPIVHLITVGEEIPFDIANMRAVSYALDDPDALEEAQEELGRKVKAIEEADWVAAPNPISAAREVSLLQGSEQPEARAAGDILAAVGELRDEVRGLTRRIPSAAPASPLRERVARYLIKDGGAQSSPALAKALEADRRAIVIALRKLEREGRVEKGDAGWVATVPF